MIEVRYRVYGPLRDIVRCDELALQVPPPCTGEAAFDVLADAFPPIRAWRPSLRLAVNLCYVPFEVALNEGDEISFLPPVSGG